MSESCQVMHRPWTLDKRGRDEGEGERNVEVPEVGDFHQRSTYVTKYQHSPACTLSTRSPLHPIDQILGLQLRAGQGELSHV